MAETTKDFAEYLRRQIEADPELKAAVEAEEREATAEIQRYANRLTDALERIRSQCGGHADEFSQNVWKLATEALAAAEKPERPPLEAWITKHGPNNYTLSTAVFDGETAERIGHRAPFSRVSVRIEPAR